MAATPITTLEERTTPHAAADDVLNEDHFRRLAAHLETKVGIKLPSAKKAMVEGRLRRRARALGLGSLDAYGRHLFTGGGLSSEFDAIVDCVTTNKTDFFREPEHFHILADRLVPTLLGAGRGIARSPLKLWSAAASSGAEAYTLAMVMTDLQSRQPCAFSILGTDVSTEILEKARRAIYPIEMIEGIPEPLQTRYVMRAVTPTRREFRIVPELRRLIRLQQLNLVAERYETERDFDVVFCRNVLIYFDRETQAAVVDRLSRHIRPGGYLMLGHSEAMAGSGRPGLRQVAPTVFQVQEAGA